MARWLGCIMYKASALTYGESVLAAIWGCRPDNLQWPLSVWPWLPRGTEAEFQDEESQRTRQKLHLFS